MDLLMAKEMMDIGECLPALVVETLVLVVAHLILNDLWVLLCYFTGDHLILLCERHVPLEFQLLDHTAHLIWSCLDNR